MGEVGKIFNQSDLFSLVLLFLLGYQCWAVHKNNSVSGRPAGWLKKARLETFFFNFAKKIIKKSKNGQYFHGEKKKEWKKKKIAAAQLASI